MASTFKPSGSLLSTDEINKKKDHKGLKSESEFVEASSHPKDCLLFNQVQMNISSLPWHFLFHKVNQLPVYVSLNKSSWRPVTPSEVDCVNKKNSIMASQINKYTWFSFEIHLVNVCAHEGNGLRKPIWKTTEPWNPIFSRISPTTWDWEGAHVHIGSQSQLTQRKTLLPRESKWSNNSV